MSVDEAPMEGAMAVLTTPATPIEDDLVTLADGLAEAAARFVHAAEAVAGGIGADHAIAILLLEVSDIPVDSYIEVFDPYASPELVAGRLSDDLTAIVSDLLHGLAHHTAGRTLEALWWWQTTYLSSWGDSGAMALRALRSLVSHVRAGAPLEVTGESDT
jgi:Domain of unknown function (DUF5063)